MTESVKAIWAAMLGELRRHWRTIFIVHIAYTVLGVALLAPLMGATARLLVHLSGQTALADQDIAWFLLTPAGIAALILIAALIVFIAAVEQTSLMAIGAGAARGRTEALDALTFPLPRLGQVLAFALRLVVRVLLLALPFLAVAGLVAWLLITEYDINYYLAEHPPEFWIAAAGIGTVLTAMAAVVLHRLLAWSLALPLVLFAGESPAGSFARSARLTRGKKWTILAVLAAWAAASLALGAVVLGIIGILGSWIAPPFFDSIRWLVVVLGALVTLWALGNLLVVAFSAGSFALLINDLYARHGPGFDTAKAVKATPAVRGRRFTASRIALVLIAVAGVAVAIGAWLLDGIKVRDDIEIIAHRGAAGKAPENTLASVRQALEDGTDWIEIDVQETADGEVVVIHDSDFMKLSGVNIKVWDATLEQLDDIDIGSWFDPAFATERVPTLRQVLEAAHGRARVVIELKYYGHDQRLEQRVVDIVEQADMVPGVAIMSLKYDGIRKIRALRPDWTIGLLTAKAVGDLTTLDADFFAVNTSMATAGFIRRAHAAGRQVWVWTVNDPVSMSRMMSMGVDGLITDEPEMARQVLTDRAGMNAVERLLVHTAVLFGRPLPKRRYRDASP